MAISDIDKTLRNVIVFTLADGIIHGGEADYIHALGEQLDIAADEIDTAITDVQEGKKSISVPRDETEARRLVHYLIQAAAADHQVDPTERNVLSQLAQRAGMTETDVDVMIAEELRALGNVADVDPNAPDDAIIEALTETIYTDFHAADADARQAQLAALAAHGSYAVIPMLRLLESYRNPDGAPNALPLKMMLVEQLGALGDKRAVYYLTQQVSIGDIDDEITSLALREVTVAALGTILGEPFTADQAGIDAAREWWMRTGRLEFLRLVL